MSEIILHSGSFIDKWDNGYRVVFSRNFSLEMDKVNINTNADSATYYLKVWSYDGDAEIKSAENWITYTVYSTRPVTGTDYMETTYKLVIDTNETGELRTGYVIVGIEGQSVSAVSRTLTVNQRAEYGNYDPDAPRNLEYLMWANPLSVTLPANGGSARVKVAPQEYNMTMNYDWVDVDTAETGYDNTVWLVFSADANESDTREAYCTLENTNYSQQHPEGRKIITITQESGESEYALNADPSYINVGRSGGTYKVYITPKVSIGTSYDIDWSFISIDIEGDSLVYTLRVQPNDGQYPRSYTFMVWRDDVDTDLHPEALKYITIYQEA